MLTGEKKRMLIRIFDYKDNVTLCELKNLDIRAISVTILSGDEVIDVYYENGKIEHFDSSTTRHTSFYDGNYVLLGAKIEEWIKSAYSNIGIYLSYKRQEMFAYEN